MPVLGEQCHRHPSRPPADSGRQHRGHRLDRQPVHPAADRFPRLHTQGRVQRVAGQTGHSLHHAQRLQVRCWGVQVQSGPVCCLQVDAHHCR